MKYPEKLPRIAKIPFYFQYFKRKYSQGINKITTQDISLELGITYPSGTVNTDLRTFIGNKGYKNFGYNIVALCNSFSKVMELSEPIKIGILGDSIDFINKDELFNIHMDVSYVTTDSNLFDYSLLILTQKVSAEFLSTLPNSIKAIYDFSNNDMSFFKGTYIQFDLAAALLETWFQTTAIYNSKD